MKNFKLANAEAEKSQKEIQYAEFGKKPAGNYFLGV